MVTFMLARQTLVVEILVVAVAVAVDEAPEMVCNQGLREKVVPVVGMTVVGCRPASAILP